MGKVSEESIAQVVASADIVDVINSYFPLKRAGTSFKANCPFHNEKTPSFTVNPARQSFKCFGCGEGGDAITFVMKYENLPFIDAVRKLAQKTGIHLIESTFDPNEEKTRQKRSRLLELQRGLSELFFRLLTKDSEAQHARDYLKSRGFGSEMAQRWQIGWAPEAPGAVFKWAKENGFSGRDLVESGIAALRQEDSPQAGIYLRFRDRLMFPIHNDYGDVIAFSGRQLREDPRSGKYINSPETPLFNKSRVCFALDKARRAIGQEKFALICEGQIDAIVCHENGLQNAIAPLGTALTEEHARLLKRYTDRIVICFDSDNAGQKATGRAFEQLAPLGLDVKVATLPNGDDPDAFIRREGIEAFRELLAKASPFFDAQLRHEALSRDLNDPTTKATVARELAPLILKLSDQVSIDAMTMHLATKLGLGAEDFRSLIQKTSQKARPLSRSHEPTIETEPQLEVSYSLQKLIKLLFLSPEAAAWADSQYEALSEITAVEKGHPLLFSVLDRHQQIPVSSAEQINFLHQFPEAEKRVLQDILELEDASSPLTSLQDIFNHLSRRHLKKQLDQKVTQLKQTGLSPSSLALLQKEILDLQRLVKEIPARP